MLLLAHLCLALSTEQFSRLSKCRFYCADYVCDIYKTLTFSAVGTKELILSQKRTIQYLLGDYIPPLSQTKRGWGGWGRGRGRGRGWLRSWLCSGWLIPNIV